MNSQRDDNDFFRIVQDRVLSIIPKHIEIFFALKMNFGLFSTYVKPEANTSVTESFNKKSFNTHNKIFTAADNLEV